MLVHDFAAERGIPCLSVKICLFMPNLLLSTGLLPSVIAPLSVILLIFYLPIAMST